MGGGVSVVTGEWFFAPMVLFLALLPPTSIKQFCGPCNHVMGPFVLHREVPCRTPTCQALALPDNGALKAGPRHMDCNSEGLTFGPLSSGAGWNA